MNSPLYFPTVTVFLDDDQRFLDSLTRYFDYESNFKYKSFLKVDDALAYLGNAASSRAMLNNIKETNLVWEPGSRTPATRFNYKKILPVLGNFQRFHIASTIVVDYQMPGINGVEFCEKIKDVPVKKIMLTGEADLEIAINAFNSGVIDAYIRKSDNNMLLKLNEKISEMKEKFFVEFLQSTPMYDTSYFTCYPAFQQYFMGVCTDKSVSETYPLSTNIVMVDYGNDNVKIIAAYTRTDIEDIAEIFKDSDLGESLARPIAEFKKAPLCLDSDFEPTLIFSEKNLHPLIKLDNEHYLIEVSKDKVLKDNIEYINYEHYVG